MKSHQTSEKLEVEANHNHRELFKTYKNSLRSDKKRQPKNTFHAVTYPYTVTLDVNNDVESESPIQK